MARPSTSPEKQLAADAHRIGVLAYFSQELRAEGKPHVRLFSRGVNVANCASIDEARVWLGLAEGRQ